MLALFIVFRIKENHAGKPQNTIHNATGGLN